LTRSQHLSSAAGGRRRNGGSPSEAYALHCWSYSSRPGSGASWLPGERWPVRRTPPPQKDRSAAPETGTNRSGPARSLPVPRRPARVEPSPCVITQAQADSIGSKRGGARLQHHAPATFEGREARDVVGGPDGHRKVYVDVFTPSHQATSGPGKANNCCATGNHSGHRLTTIALDTAKDGTLELAAR
jgi:hypothetical protein